MSSDRPEWAEVAAWADGLGEPPQPEPTPETLADAAHDASRAIRAAADAVRILRYPGEWSLAMASGAAQEHLAHAITHAQDAIHTLAHDEAGCPWCAADEEETDA